MPRLISLWPFLILFQWRTTPQCLAPRQGWEVWLEVCYYMVYSVSPVAHCDSLNKHQHEPSADCDVSLCLKIVPVWNIIMYNSSGKVGYDTTTTTLSNEILIVVYRQQVQAWSPFLNKKTSVMVSSSFRFLRCQLIVCPPHYFSFVHYHLCISVFE